jgi:transcription elongation factor Elf1
MNAKVRELWLIVECPNCQRPQIVNKYVKDNAVIRLLQTRYMTCTMCEKNYFVKLEELDTELDRPDEKPAMVNMSG